MTLNRIKNEYIISGHLFMLIFRKAHIQKIFGNINEQGDHIKQLCVIAELTGK